MVFAQSTRSSARARSDSIRAFRGLVSIDGFVADLLRDIAQKMHSHGPIGPITATGEARFVIGLGGGIDPAAVGARAGAAVGHGAIAPARAGGLDGGFTFEVPVRGPEASLGAGRSLAPAEAAEKSKTVG